MAAVSPSATMPVRAKPAAWTAWKETEMAIQTAGNWRTTKQRTGTLIALAMGGALAAVVTAVGVVTWRDATGGAAQATVATPASSGVTREAPPIGGLAELYAEREAATRRAEVERIDRQGGMAELYREQAAVTGPSSIPGEDTRGGLAELYAEQEAARRAAASEPDGD
jgi:hypothetical protein